MSDEASFLAAIRANPDDDLVREVYCDFLEESRGSIQCQHAEFIRVQLALSRMKETWDEDGPKAELLSRELALWRAPWFFHYYPFENRPCGLITSTWQEPKSVPAVRFRRGFPDEVVCRRTSDWWIPGGPITSRNPCSEVALATGPGPQILKAYPTITRVTVERCRPSEEFLFGPHRGRTGWWWRLAGPYLDALPLYVFERLEGFDGAGADFAYYLTREAALRSLSDAMLDLVRPKEKS